jgi:Gas vesicle synthesis protein GvpL/GvpF
MATRMSRNSTRVIYFYGLTKKVAGTLETVAGVDGASLVESLPCSGLLCWISRVPKSEFADNLQHNMQDLDWLTTATIHHQRVVSTIARLGDVLPARFGTVFLNEESLAQDIASRKRILKADLERIKDSDEWGVKIFRRQPKVELPPGPARSGKDYLKAKAALMQRRPEKMSDADIERFADALKRIAVGTAEVGKVSGGQRGLQWQTSLLLRRDDRKKFEALLKKFSEEWADRREIEATGPWPPYSFVSRGGSEPTV